MLSFSPMTSTAASTRSPGVALIAGGIAVAASVAGRERIDPWLFGVVLLIAWGLLSYGLSVLRVARPLRWLVIVTLFALTVVVWNYTARQPRIQLSAIRAQKLPSTVLPGRVELVFANDGSLPADVVGSAVATLGPLFRTGDGLVAGGMEAEESRRLEQAARVPAEGALVITPGKSVRVNVDIPPSERSWYVGSGQATVLVTARVRYRDRLFHRDKVFCLFMTPPSSHWQSCPFLNN
jgi:hypothetical protein